MTTIYAGLKVKAKCPKCKSRDFKTVEVFEEIVICSVRNGVFPDQADDHQPGGIVGVSCECDKCGHMWKPRGAKSLGDIVVRGGS